MLQHLSNFNCNLKIGNSMLVILWKLSRRQPSASGKFSTWKRHNRPNWKWIDSSQWYCAKIIQLNTPRSDKITLTTSDARFRFWIGIDSRIIPLLTGIGIGIGTFCWNRNWNRNQATLFWIRPSAQVPQALFRILLPASHIIHYIMCG